MIDTKNERVYFQGVKMKFNFSQAQIYSHTFLQRRKYLVKINPIFVVNIEYTLPRPKGHKMFYSFTYVLLQISISLQKISFLC